ncbi:MAG: M48 family metalloprotease [Leptolyngbyaceae cyanobacterium MO_188.B28]|nr:M48 family metalloprotease [Leptolyngbyaceae cyanobacterium MO_188.B28]
MRSTLLQRGLAITTSLIALTFPISFIEGKSALAQISENRIESAETQLLRSRNRHLYAQAKAELPAEFYAFYRIVDRITRANELDVPYWRIRSSNNVIGAYAHGAYSLSINTDLLALMEGNVSAVAYIIAHEMAHHVSGHTVQYAKFQQDLSEEISTAIGESRDLVEIMEEIARASSNFQDRFQAFRQHLEIEADEVALKYMARAGFNPEGAVQVFAVYRDIYGINEEMEARLEKIKSLPSLLSLADQGRKRIATTAPMSYELSESGNSLRIMRESIDYAAILEDMFDR